MENICVVVFVFGVWRIFILYVWCVFAVDILFLVWCLHLVVCLLSLLLMFALNVVVVAVSGVCIWFVFVVPILVFDV